MSRHNVHKHVAGCKQLHDRHFIPRFSWSSFRAPITYTNTSLDWAPTGGALLHSLFLMELIAHLAYHLVGTREKNHGHLLGQAHYALPFTLYTSIPRYHQFGDVRHGGIFKLGCISDFTDLTGVATVYASFKSSYLWWICLQPQPRNLLFKSRNVIFVLL